MAKELFEKGVFLYITAGVAGIGVLLRLILSMVYRRLVGASEHMGKTRNKWAKQLKSRFETCYQLKIGVKNVDIFVDKYVYKQKFCGVLLSTWELISGQMKYLCLLAASVGGIIGLVTECGRNEILFTFFTGLWTSALLMIVDNMSGLKGKKQILRLNLKDYLENFLKVRFENPEEYDAIQKEYAYSSETQAAPSKKEKRRMLKMEKAQEKLERKQEKARGKEQKKLLAEQKKKEEEAKYLEDLENQRMMKERKKAEAAERRRQQLVKMEGDDEEDWGMTAAAEAQPAFEEGAPVSDMPETAPSMEKAAEPVDFTKAAAEKTGSKSVSGQNPGKTAQSRTEGEAKKAEAAPRQNSSKRPAGQKDTKAEQAQTQARTAAIQAQAVAEAQTAAAKAPAEKKGAQAAAQAKGSGKKTSQAEDKLIADVLKEFLS